MGVQRVPASSEIWGAGSGGPDFRILTGQILKPFHDVARDVILTILAQSRPGALLGSFWL